MNKKNYIKASLLFYLIISTPVFSQNKKPLSKNNINEKIHEAYIIYEENDDEKLIVEIFEYLTLHNIKIKNLAAKGRILYLEGTMRYNINDVKKAIKLLEEALLIATNNNDKNLKAASLHALGVFYSATKIDTISLEYFNQALDVFKKIGAETQQIDIYFNQTLVYRKLEDWKNCKSSAKSAIAIIKKQNKKKIRLRYLYGVLALSNAYLGYHKEAKENIKTTIQLVGTKKNTAVMQYIFLTRAMLYEKEDNYKEANVNFRKYIEALNNNRKFKRNRLREFLHKELELKNELNKIKDREIKQRNLLLYLSLFFLVAGILFILSNIKLSKRLKKNNIKIKGLNHELQDSLINVESTNLNLKNKNENIAHLLNLNERTLFSKVLKISTYNDIVSKLASDLSSLIDSEIAIKSNDLFRIEKALTSMVNEDEIWDDFQIQFEKTRPHFFEKLKKLAPDLSINDLKHCSYIIAKLRTKDVANLINVSPRSVETTRYRIKKKLNLGIESNLYNFLDSL